MTSTLCSLFLSASALLAYPQEEITLRVQLLDNGSASDAHPDPRPGGVPWWRAVGEPAARISERDGSPWLHTPAGAGLEQPVAAFAPTLAELGATQLLIRGRVAGRGTLSLRGAGGARITREVGEPRGTQSGESQSFEWNASDMTGGVPGPRLVFGIASELGAHWTDLEVLVPLPLPSRAALRSELVDHMDEIFRPYMQRGRDVFGERETALIVQHFDIVTGEPIGSPGAAQINQIFESLLRAVAVHPDSDWSGWLDEFLTDYLELCFHPTTGLPQHYDSVADAGLADVPVEIARDLQFLLDVHEYGPQKHRARAMDRARQIAETVLEHGRLPDGSIAVKYIPRDASPRLDVIDLRALNVAALLTRVGALAGDERMLETARVALGCLEYTLFWGGTWAEIDPDFDDRFGNWGARAVDMLACYPDEPVFRGFIERGYDHFAPRWAGSMRFGGSTAADQVRCWKLLAQYADLSGDAATLASVDELLTAAVRLHFKGEQYDTGAWGDVTVAGFDPRAGLNVGDLDGVPQNLLEGIAFVHARAEPDSREAQELRAMFTAVLRSSAEAYRHPHGWLATRHLSDTINPPYGTHRVLPGLTAMLESLSR